MKKPTFYAALLAAGCLLGGCRLIYTDETGWIDADSYVSGSLGGGSLEEGRAAFERGDYAAAEEYLEPFAEGGVAGREGLEALWLYAETQYALERYERAYAAWEKYRMIDPSTGRIKELLERQLACGYHLIGGAPREVYGLMIFSGGERGEEILTKILQEYPYEEFSDDAQFRLAGYYFSEGRYEEARNAYQLVVDRYHDTSEWVAKAQFQIAMCSYTLSEDADYDTTQLHEAREAFEEYRQRGGESVDTEEAEDKIREILEVEARKLYGIGEFYMERHAPTAAAMYWRRTIEKCPGTEGARKAQAAIEALRAQPEE